MKYKILFGLLFIAAIARGQGGGFPSTDSLHRYDNRFITNSAINAFTDYRMNTMLHGIINWIDSARLGTGGSVGVDTIYALNDSTIRYRKNSVFHNFTLRGAGLTLNAQNGLTFSGGIAKLGGNLNQALTIINGRNAYSVLWDSTASWIVRDALGTTYINFDYSNPLIQLASGSTFWRIRGDGILGSAINGFYSFTADSANFTHSNLLTINSPIFKIRNIGTSSDTTTYKPLGIASDGTIKGITLWPGGGFGGTPDTLANPIGFADSILMHPSTHRFLLRALVAGSLTNITPTDTTLAIGLANNTANTLLGFNGSGVPSDITLTTTGSSGPATISGGVLNIPQYSGGSGTLTNLATGYGILGGPITTTGTIKVDTSTIDARYRKIYNVKLYGAKGDGVESFGGNSNGTTTFTCSTCSFSSLTDVGKVILIDSVNSGNLDLLTTIASVTNSTTIVLSGATTITKSGVHFVYGTDDTNPIQNAINAANAAGGGIVYLPHGIFIINGALQTSINGVNPNSQLYIPAADSSRDPNVCTITIEGEIGSSYVGNDPLNNISYWPSTKGTILYSTINGSGSAACVIGSKGPSTSFANFNYSTLVVKNVSIINRINPGGNGPTVGGINAGYMGNFIIDNVLVTVNNITFNEPLPTSDAAGIIMPFNNSETINSNSNTLTIGYRYGQVFAEHVDFNNAQASSCFAGFTCLRNGHASASGRIEPFWCKYDLYFPNFSLYGQTATNSAVMFPTFDMEGISVGKWYDQTAMICDSGNHAFGYVLYKTGNSVGSNVGATNLITNPYDNIYSVQKPTQVDIQGGTGTDPLSITSTSSSNSRVRLYNGNAAGQSALYLADQNNNLITGYGGSLYGNGSNASGNLLGVSRANHLFYFADGSSNTGLSIGTLNSTFLGFGTSNIEAGRINPSQEWQIGSTTDQGAFTLQNTGGLYQNGTFSLRGTLSAPTGGLPLLVKYTDSTVLQIAQSSLTGVPNIYNVDGTLSGNRIVTMSSHTLDFNGGNVGIATSTPRQLLDILNTTNPQLRLTYTDNSVYTDFQVTSGGQLGLTPTGTNSIIVKSGTASQYIGVGGSVFDIATDAGNTTTTETDLYANTLPANFLTTDKQKIDFKFEGIYVGSTSLKQIKVYFAGTQIFASGTLAVTTNAEWEVKGYIIRASSTTARCYVTLATAGVATEIYDGYIALTGLDFTTTNILKITGQASSTGAATNDIVLKMGTGEWKPAAPAGS